MNKVKDKLKEGMSENIAGLPTKKKPEPNTNEDAFRARQIKRAKDFQFHTKQDSEANKEEKKVGNIVRDYSVTAQKNDNAVKDHLAKQVNTLKERIEARKNNSFQKSMLNQSTSYLHQNISDKLKKGDMSLIANIGDVPTLRKSVANYGSERDSKYPAGLGEFIVF